MEKIERNASYINATLQTMQKEWYEGLKDCKFNYYDLSMFSSPFYFGISEKTIEECNCGKDLLMYVGEEAKDWTFDQQWAINYFDSQIYNDQSNDCKKNNSAFWNFLRNIIKEKTKVAACWNNLDKLHQKIQNKNGEETKPLTYKQEKPLHNPFGDDQRHSLLWHEINLVRPNYIIFMGPKYNCSIEWAFSLPERSLKLKEKPNARKVVDLTETFKNIFSSGYQPKVFWICHPGWLQRKGVFQSVLEELLKKINA